MNKFKTTFNGKTLCVFVVIDSDIVVHLANIDTITNRMYTTIDGYNLVATNLFKQNHSLLMFDEEPIDNSSYEDDFTFEKSKQPFRKFNACVGFHKYEIPSIIKMCSREFEF